MWILLILFYALVIMHFYDLFRNHKKYTGNVVNYDPGMRVFCYRVEKTREEIWKSLCSNDRYTATKYRFDSTCGVITFYPELPDGRLDVSYAVLVTEQIGYSILNIVQQDHFGERDHYQWQQNEFWSQKLDAVPVAYQQESYRI